MKSMTGFGNFRAQSNEVSIEVSIRAVNGRFLETRFHLPRSYFSHEADLKKKFSSLVIRGTVDIYIARKIKSNLSSGKIVVNSKLAQEYFKAFKKLSMDLRISDTIRFEHIAKQPDVIQVEESDMVTNHEVSMLKKAFDAALKKFDIERLREGAALKKDLQKNLKDLHRHILKVTKLREEANKLLQERFESRVKARLPKEVAGQQIDPGRISQEVVIQLEKADINEELIRLAEHIKNFDKLVELTIVEGKKLDFYTQELLREVNTIGSKSQVAGITEAVVEAKTLIERIKEQVQNIE
ncbi:MAG: YicC/YloC family endoribonuclease [Bdellovibrionota bacterium]